MRALLLIMLAFLLSAPARAEEHAPSADERVAQAPFEKQLQLHPDSAAAHSLYAEYLSDHGQTRAAITHWRLAQILEPGNGAIANSLGGAYLRAGRAAESANQFQRAVDKASNVAAYHYNLGNVEYVLRRDLTAAWQINDATLLQRALAEFRMASRLSPNDMEYARSYAETFYGIDAPDWAEAEVAWKRVLALSPESDFAYLQLARVSLNRGDKAKTLLFLDRVKDSRHDGLKQKLRERADQL